VRIIVVAERVYLGYLVGDVGEVYLCIDRYMHTNVMVE
jgi:hypothetical protein